MTAILVSVIGLIFAAEVAAIVWFIVRNGKPFPKLPKRKKRSKGIESEADRDARLAGPLNLPPPRDDLAEPFPAPETIERIHIGRPPKRVPGATITPDLGPADAEQVDAPPLEFVERLARAMEPEGSPWRVSPDSAVGISQAAREANATWASYRPRHARDGETTLTFKAITARLASEDTTEIGVRAA